MRDGGWLRRLRVRVRGEHVLACALGQRQSARRAVSTVPVINARTISRCCIRYIVMSMSLRDRAVCSRPAASSPQASTISARGRRTGPRRCRRIATCAHLGQRDPVERARIACASASGMMPALGQHHEMRIVDAHQRREELRLGVLEVFVENACDVLRSESHASTNCFPRLSRFASNWYAPSVPAGSWRQRPRPM